MHEILKTLHLHDILKTGYAKEDRLCKLNLQLCKFKFVQPCTVIEVKRIMWSRSVIKVKRTLCGLALDVIGVKRIMWCRSVCKVKQII